MRKASLSLGIVYLLWSAWQYVTVTRILSLYSQFSAEKPSNVYLLSILIFAVGIALIIGYFINFKNKAIYKFLVAIGVAGIIIYVVYIFIAGSIANRQISQMLNEVRISQ